MMRLTLHRAKTRHLPHQPLLRLAAATRIFGKQLPALLGEIEQDRPALEYGQRRTAADGLMVDDRGQAAIGVDTPIFGGQDRKSVGKGKRGPVRVDLGGRGKINKKKKIN